MFFQIQVNQLKIEKIETKNHASKLEDEIKTLKTLVSHLINIGYTNPSTTANVSNHTAPLNSTHSNFLLQNPSNCSLLTAYDNLKRHNSMSVKYNSHDVVENDILPIQQQFNDLLKENNANYKRNSIAQKDEIYANTENDNNDSTIVQMEKDNLELRRELQDALASNKEADKKIQKYFFKFNLNV